MSTRPISSSSPTAPPRTWLCVGSRLGDNAQVEVLAEALGWPFERKRVFFREPWEKQKPRVRPTLRYVDRERSDALAPPWPDLILTIGRRLSMVALWIREQSRGRTKIVLLGKPSGMLEHFDLVVPSAENPLPARPNVLPLDLPLMSIDEEALAAASERWQEIDALPRPVTAVLVGGPTKPFRFTTRDADELTRRVGREFGDEGTLWVTTSPRTTPDLVAALRAGLRPDARFYAWKPKDPENPYLGLLARADRFIVTADSISMMVEVARLGRPLAIYPLELEPKGWSARLRYRMANRLLTRSTREGARIPAEPLGDALYRHGMIRFERDFAAIHQALVRRGAAVRFGDPLPASGRPVPNELEGVLACIHALLDPGAMSDAVEEGAARGGSIGQG